MKQFLGILIIFGSLQFSNAADTPKVEEKVVQLHILRADPPVVESVFKKRKSIELKGSTEVGRGVCSGAFVSESGNIITARHCVEGTVAIEAETYDQQIYNATTVYISSTADLALLHVNRRNTPYFKLANSVTRGEKVYVLGSPLAIADTLAMGIVAKLWGDIMLIDCSVLPGNSGGPAFDDNGELIGITTSGFVVFLGMTHLNVAQSLDAIYYFLVEAAKHS